MRRLDAGCVGARQVGVAAYDGIQVVEKVSSSPSLDVELVDVPAVVAVGSRGPRRTSLSGPATAVITSSPPIVAAAYPGHDLAVVHAHHPLVPHPHRAAHAGHPAHHVGPVVAGRHHVEQRDHAGRRW